MSIALPPDRPERAGELLSSEEEPLGEEPLLSRFSGARREMGRRIPVPAGENKTANPDESKSSRSAVTYISMLRIPSCLRALERFARRSRSTKNRTRIHRLKQLELK